jgi:hypothetical protein
LHNVLFCFTYYKHMKKFVVAFIFILVLQIANAQTKYDIVIAEIMADPTPQIGLPNSEWIEIKNTTTAPINLLGWRIGDATGISGPMAAFNLLPDSSITICTASAVAGLAVFGNTISVTSFPSLDNNGKLLYVRAPNGRTIHAVDYSINWYQNSVKSDGGYTLEMIDTKNPCSGASNWIASKDVKGGTPSKTNSQNGANKDITAPRLLKGVATDATTITITFNEPLDSLKAATIANYSISDGVGVPTIATANAPLFNTVTLKIATALVPNKVYTITANNLSDCVGNNIASFNTCKLGVATVPDSLNLVINEVLFNPKPNSFDYVEIYNNSSKIVDLKNIIIGNRNASGVIGSIKNLSVDNYLLLPGEYMVITENAEVIKNEYNAKNATAFTELTSLPSMPDDKGNIVLLTAAGNIIDELKYDSKWHFALLDNEEGVALERIDFNKPTNDANNWSSAASTVTYGTPTYQNSQYRANIQLKGSSTITPPIFSPDNDGFDDFAFINFSFAEPNNVANITIYDGSGRPIRVLQKNATMAANASFKWDGLDDKQQKVPIGIYVIYSQVFNTKGVTQQFKNTVVVARKF